MRKIGLENYSMENGKEYKVLEAVSVVLFHGSLNLGAKDVLDRGKLFDKIKNSEKEVLLEDAEYEVLKNSVERIKGFSKDDIVFLERILKAELVEVQEAKK